MPTTPFHPHLINGLKDPSMAVAFIKAIFERDESDGEITEDQFDHLVGSAIADIIEAYGGNHAPFRSSDELEQIQKSWVAYIDGNAQ